MNRARIIVFAKAPQPGRAKTRLIPALGAEGAANLARAMLLATVAEAQAAGVGPVELCVDPEPTHPAWPELQLPALIEWSAQGDGDLGARMARAARRGLQQGLPVLLIGTDCPDLDAERLRQSVAALERADAVLVPTFDGGYALLGLRRFDASLFEDIPWSTASVADLTRARLDALGWRVELGPMLHDIDTPEDLALVHHHGDTDARSRFGSLGHAARSGK